MKITEIVSNGKPGAERGALFAAHHCNLAQHPPRQNLSAIIADSDATLVLTAGHLDEASARATATARRLCRPVLHIDATAIPREAARQAILAWLDRRCPATGCLHVTGTATHAMQNFVASLMVAIVNGANSTSFYPLPEEELAGDMVPPSPPPEGWNPRTLDEAASIVVSAMQPATRDSVAASADRVTFCADSHRGIGLWIRNNLIHTNENKLHLFAVFQRGAQDGRWKGFVSPDAISVAITGLVWDTLHT